MSDVLRTSEASGPMPNATRDATHRGLVAALIVVARALLLPLLGAYRLGLLDYRGCGECLSLVPGPSGRLLRRAWYSSTLAHCGARLTVHFGTILRDPRTRVGDDCIFGERNSVGVGGDRRSLRLRGSRVDRRRPPSAKVLPHRHPDALSDVSDAVCARRQRRLGRCARRDRGRRGGALDRGSERVDHRGLSRMERARRRAGSGDWHTALSHRGRVMKDSI